MFRSTVGESRHRRQHRELRLGFRRRQTASQSVLHTVWRGGHVHVKLTVTDNQGATNQTSLAVGVTVPPDTTPPTVQSLALAMPSPTMADTVTYTLSFSEPVTGVTSGNFAIVTSGITGASIGSISGGGATWTVWVSTGRNTGSLRLDVANGVGITDAGGNPLVGTSFTGETYQIDKGGTVVGTGEGQPVTTFGSQGYALFNEVQAAPEAARSRSFPVGESWRPEESDAIRTRTRTVSYS